LSCTASRRPPRVEGRQRSLADDAMALLLVADLLAEFFFEGFEQVEGNVCGLKVFWVGVGDVVDQRSKGAGARRGDGFFAAGQGSSVDSGKQAGGDGFGIALDAGELAGEEDRGWFAAPLRGARCFCAPGPRAALRLPWAILATLLRGGIQPEQFVERQRRLRGGLQPEQFVKQKRRADVRVAMNLAVA